MENIPSFQQFLAQQDTNIDPQIFVINLILAALCALVLSFIYNWSSRTISNKSSFSRNFVLITVTTMIIISIVKSSLALSLGLVGALSIIRFRTAIKEPEELAYLFINICLGLGFGANQRFVTLLGFGGLVVLLVSREFLRPRTHVKNFYLVISTSNLNSSLLDKVTTMTNDLGLKYRWKRLQNTNQGQELALEFENLEDSHISDLSSKLKSLDSSSNVQFYDARWEPF